MLAAFISCSSVPALADPLGKAPEATKEATKEPARDSQSVDSKMSAHPSLPGSEINRHDPLAIYREAGIDKEQEKKIRQLAKEFEDSQRVRLALMANLLKDMRNLQMEPDPNEKIALAKQDEINKVQAEMGTERVKLVLKIRSVLTFDEKQRLIDNMRHSVKTAK
ncbi:hypothetical protein KBI23_19220 [bacterium]|nr:hypothetical protein [bacterium]MBP9810870.1 hypothetical protein [bacterium]